MFDRNKKLTAKAYLTFGDKNMKCTILVMTNAYDMDIDNSDIKQVIQWNLPIFFDTIIQHLGRASRINGQSTFILFIPK